MQFISESIPQSACTLLGITSTKAPKINEGTKCPITCLPPEADGYLALRMQPLGAEILIGFVAPSLLGISGIVSDLIENKEKALV